MRMAIVSEFVSLDGVMEDPGGTEKFEHGGWTMPFWSEEIGKSKFDELFASGALLLGRVTYEGFAAAWPPRADEADIADRMNSLKLVVSKTLDKVEWNNSSLVRENVAEQVSKLKQQPGQDILIAGSGQLVKMLVQHDLVDEFRLLVYPVVLGSGKRPFRGRRKMNLIIVETRSFSSGVALLR